MKSKIIQGATLLFFLSLITIFVAHQAGYFSKQKLSQPVSSSKTTKDQIDTILNIDSSKIKTLLPSSKSILLPENLFELNDTVN